MSDDPIKDALRLMPYGFYCLTSRNGDDMNAMVANWITQASFTPRLIVIGLQKTSYTHGVIEEGRVFCINLFKKEDEESMMPFTKGRAKTPDKMKDAVYTEAPETKCPVLEGAAAYVECKVIDIHDVGGDHVLVVGEAVGADVMKEAEVGDMMTLPHIGWSYAG
jgi:flavin reductase (DIM6/NTAB) family NADH-FMN oxidoreductase RutF